MPISSVTPDDAEADFICDNCENEETLTLRESIKQEEDPYEIPCSECSIGRYEQQTQWRDP